MKIISHKKCAGSGISKKHSEILGVKETDPKSATLVPVANKTECNAQGNED
jgi:hypothetical protein